MKLEIEVPTPEVFSQYKSAADLSGMDSAELLASGIKSAREGNRADARRKLMRVTELEPQNETAWLWLASISEYPEELLVFLDKVLKFSPNNQRALEWKQATKTMMAETFVQRGIAAVEENQKSLAVQCFSQALMHDDRNEEAWFHLAAQADSIEDKSVNLRKVLSINPNHEAARLSLQSLQKDLSQSLLKKANFAAISGEREEANRLLEQAMAEKANAEEAWMLRAYLAETNEEKIAAYEMILGINPNNEAARAGLDSLRDLIRKTEALNFAPAIAANENPALNSLPTADTAEPAAILQESSFSFASNDVAAYGDSSFAPAAEDSNYSFDMPTEEKSDLSDMNFMGNDSMPQNEASTDINFSDFASNSEFSSNSDFASNAKAFSFDELPAVDEKLPMIDENPVESQFVSAEVPFVEEMPESFRADENALSSSSPAPVEGVNQAPIYEAPAAANESSPVQSEAENSSEASNICPFCYATNQAQAFVCQSCRTMLSLSDLEMLLAHQEAKPEVLEMAIEDLEAERSSRGLSGEELQNLGLAYLNLKNLRKGLNCLQEAAQMNPNDIVLASKVNFLAIRLAEIELHESKMENSGAKHLTVLVVDDSATVRKLISSKLEKSGHSVVCAADGGEALDRIKEFVPDLVLLDIMMPQMDGYQVCKLIRANEQTKDVPIVMISGKDGFFDKVRGRMAGTTGYITKPFGPETLMKTIETYVA